MAKQIYIDSNGNELLVSGTISTATNMPISASQSTTMTKSYIDSGLSGKANTSNFTVKTAGTSSPLSVGANTIETTTFTVNDATYGIICGFAVSNSSGIVPVQIYFSNSTTITARVRNLQNATDTCHILVKYI